MKQDAEGVRRTTMATMPDQVGMMPVGAGTFVVDVAPPDGRRFWLTDEMLPRGRNGKLKTAYRISEMTKFFFGRSPDWMRWLDGRPEGVFKIDGAELIIKRTEAGSRYFTLADVERLAHALLEHGRIDGQQFISTISLVKWVAFSYGILTAADMTPRIASVDPNQGVIPGIDTEIERIAKEQAR